MGFPRKRYLKNNPANQCLQNQRTRQEAHSDRITPVLLWLQPQPGTAVLRKDRLGQRYRDGRKTGRQRIHSIREKQWTGGETLGKYHTLRALGRGFH